MSEKEKTETLERRVEVLERCVSDMEYTIRRTADNVNQNTARQLAALLGTRQSFFDGDL